MPRRTGKGIIKDVMVDFFTHNPTLAPAIAALAGVLVGGLLSGVFTFLNAWVMRNRDLDLKLWEDSWIAGSPRMRP
jgi:hypothetical protein